MNLLLVEDDDRLRNLLRLVLERRGHRVFDAAGAKDAIALAQQQPVDLLITDVVLPGPDGWDLARSVVKQYPDIAILFMSGYMVDAQWLANKGLNSHFLHKPFSPIGLDDAIAQLMEKRTLVV